MFGVQVVFGVCFLSFVFTLVGGTEDEMTSPSPSPSPSPPPPSPPPSASSSSLSLVPKCCALNENINNEGNCVSSEEPLSFQPYFADTPESFTNFTENHLKVGNPCASGRYRLEPHEISLDEYILYSNGTLIVTNQLLLLGVNDYCLEVFLIDNQEQVLPLICFSQDSKSTVYPNESIWKIQMYIYPIGMLVSMFFLLLTTAAYLWIPTLRNTHGRAVALYAFSLAIGYLSLAIAYLGGMDLLQGHFCVPIGFIIQYSFVTSFFWLNVICYDLWRRMRKISFKEIVNKKNPEFKLQLKKKEKRPRLIYYCIYAYCCPLLLTLLTLGLDLSPTIPQFTKPNIGLKSCWFGTDKAALPLFYGPMVALIVLNMILVCLSLKKIIIARRNKLLPLPYRNNFYLLIFTLMLEIGLPWIMEFVSWWQESNSYVWICIDFLNVTLGIIIFCVFVLEKSIIGFLRNHWNTKIRSVPNTPSALEQGPPPSSPLLKIGPIFP